MLCLDQVRINNKGFTLIELLIVIAIITILATIAIPQFTKYKTQAYNAVAVSDVKQMQMTLEAYYVSGSSSGDIWMFPSAFYTGMALGQWVAYTNIDSAIEGNTWNAAIPFKFSDKMNVYYDTETNRQRYVLAAKHEFGDTVYIVTSEASRTYYKKNDSWRSLAITEIEVGNMPKASDNTTLTDYWLVTNDWNKL